MARKNPAAVVVERKARKKSDRARSAKSGLDNSDQALATLLSCLRASVDPAEIRQLSDQIERVIFHRQMANA
jgi:hypothetical protein